MADETQASHAPAGADEASTAAIEEFAQALRAHGLLLEGAPEMDGEFHTVPVVDGKPGKHSGSYWGSLDGAPHGYIENFITGAKQRWQGSGPTRALTQEEQAAVAERRRDRAASRVAEQERRAEIVGKEWSRLRAAPDNHAYLVRKGVLPHDLRLDRHGNLVMPLVDIEDKLWSVQRINEAGDKLFTKGGRTAGAFSPIGDVHDAAKPIVIAEGYATSASVYEITGLPVVVALNAGNLKPVAEAFRAKYPERAIFIAGDNDHGKEAAGKPNVGKLKSADAGQAVGGHVLLPAFSPNDPGTDWNDLAKSMGKAQVREQIGAALATHGIALGASMGKEARLYLNVPFKEKKEARELGARFDVLEKKWYLPPGVDSTPFERWKTAEQPDPSIAAPAIRGPGTRPTMNTADPQIEASRPAFFARRPQPSKQDDDPRIEREAERLSAVVGDPIDKTRELVRDLLKQAEERGGPAAREAFLAERAALPRNRGNAPEPTSPAAASAAGDEKLGRDFRAELQSIATSTSLRGAEVNLTLALDQQVETIHHDAWRQTGEAAAGDRAIGELIRTGAGFAAEPLPPQAAAALAKLRQDAGLAPQPAESTQPKPAGQREAVRELREEIEADEAQALSDLADEIGEIAQRPAHDAPADEPTVVAAEASPSAVSTPDAQRPAEPTPAPSFADVYGQNTNPDLYRGVKPEFAGRVRETEAGEKVIDGMMMHAEVRLKDGSEVVVNVGGSTIFAGDGDIIDVSAVAAFKNRAAGAQWIPVKQEVAEAVSIEKAQSAREAQDYRARAAANEPLKRAANDPDTTSPIATSNVERTDQPAANEGDARNPANDAERPVLDTVSPADQARIKAARERDSAQARETLGANADARATMARSAKSQQPGGARKEEEDGPDTADNVIELEASRRKPILSKDGYDIPPAIAARYMTKEGRYWKLDGGDASGSKPSPKSGGKSDEKPRPQFEDKGPRLASQHNDRATIADMVAIVQAKNWDAATVKGSETFRRNAWIELSLAGLEVNGFKPKESDQALLEAAKRERDALTISGGKPPAPTSDRAPATAATSEGAPAKPAASTPTQAATATAAAPVANPSPSSTSAPTRAAEKGPKPGGLTVAQMREQLSKAVEKMPARTRTELLNRFDARIQAALEVQTQIDRGELKPEAAGAAIDSRFAAMHTSWAAPKAAPTASQHKPDAQPSPSVMPKAM